MNTPNAPARVNFERTTGRASKIHDTHRLKLAMVYIRQSTPQQILEHRESTLRQYALVETAVALGWERERVLVVDEDQGQSGRSAQQRQGFQRLLAEVTLDHVGLILGLEMSRFARSDKDWHQLLEVCSVFGTLLADQDGVYDPRDPNDRLLLGLKGTMSTLELQTMRNRLDQGKRFKAQRGELFVGVPVGYVRSLAGGVALDPDAQVQATLRLVFDKFDELGTIHQLSVWLQANQIGLPFRLREGPRRGELDWRVPAYSYLREILRHPMYAGAYSYGRKPLDPRRRYRDGKASKRCNLPMSEWQVLLRDRLPAYISWERYLQNLERMKQNQTTRQTPGSPRGGVALVAGLVRCGCCGWRLQTYYHAPHNAGYACRRHWATPAPACGYSVGATQLDALVAQQVLTVLQPAAIALSLQATQDVQQEQQRLEQHWQQILERACYEVELAERRYRAVDPRNRLVASTLEQQWEEALQRQRSTLEEYHRFTHQPRLTLTHHDQERIQALATAIPTLWQAATTTAADRQAIVRCLIERVVLHAAATTEQATVEIVWAGGPTTLHDFVRRRQSYARLQSQPALRERILALREEGLSAVHIAQQLNEEGYHPLNPEQPFTADIVRGLFRKMEVRGEIQNDELRGPNEWWLHDLAAELEMPWETLRGWAARGWIHSRQTKVQALWLLWVDATELKRWRKLRAAITPGRNHYPPALTTPKPRPPSKPRKSSK
jgi:DNA invertase Pin-like site-specific DNA recombinase